MPRSSLVTGADGFTGQHLVAELLASGRRVVGAVRALPPQLTILSHAAAVRVTWVPFDLEDERDVRELVERHPVSEVFHLAALTSVAQSWSAGAAAFRVNVIGTFSLVRALIAARTAGRADPVVLVVGSGEGYGASARERLPLTEEAPLKPMSPYAVSKVAQELVALQAYRAHGLRVVTARSFNHTGPGQRPPFVAPQLGEQILRAAREGPPARVRVGNLDARRDFTDVRDAVRAYRLLAEKGRPGRAYNVCRGAAVSIRELLSILAELAGVRVEPIVDPARLRPVDLPEVYGSPAALKAATGWQAEIPLRETLADLLRSLEA